MIFMFGVLIGVVYSVMRFVFCVSKKATNVVIAVCIIGLGITLDCVYGTTIEFTGIAMLVCVCVLLLCADGEHTVTDEKAMHGAIESQKRQEEYDNNWGYIHHKK